MSAGPGRLLLEPFASATRFWKAAAGLKNICENLDHGTDPKSTVVSMRYKPRNTLVHELPVACRYAQTRPSVALARSERMNRSALTMRNGELLSATTSTRIKNQNQR